MRLVENLGRATGHQTAAFSKLVAMVRIEKNVSRTSFENANMLISRGAGGGLTGFSKTFLCEKEEGGSNAEIGSGDEECRNDLACFMLRFLN